MTSPRNILMGSSSLESGFCSCNDFHTYCT